MEAAISQPKATAPHFRAPTPKIGALRPNILRFPAQINQRNRSLKKEISKCAKGDSASEEKIVAENEEELNLEEELKKLNSKCGGIGGVVELLECLEREAIMGEDEGREPNDYNRRALIFDRSSRVFQALKQQSESESESTSASCV